jgi:hypothetical protein
MVPLYATRVQDLGPGDFVRVSAHDMLIPANSLSQALRLPPTTLIMNLERRFRCRECDAKVKVVVSVKWGD